MTMSNNTPEQKDSQNSKQRNPKTMKKADEAMVLNSAYPLFWFGSYIVHALR